MKAETTGQRSHFRSQIADFTECFARTAKSKPCWSEMAGAILRSEDAGETWTDQSDSTSITTDLRGIWRDQAGRWLAVGAQASVLESSDGKMWRTLSGPQANGPTLHDLRLLPDAKQGFAWGEQGTWWGTDDGGKTWKPVVTPNGETDEIFYAARFPQSPRVGFVVGEKSILSTEDAGLTWKTLRTDGPYYSLSFRDNFNGVVVGKQICRTEDSGKNWLCQPLGVDGPMYSVAFSNAETGCAVGAKGALLCTTGWWALVESRHPSNGRNHAPDLLSQPRNRLHRGRQSQSVPQQRQRQDLAPRHRHRHRGPRYPQRQFSAQ